VSTDLWKIWKVVSITFAFFPPVTLNCVMLTVEWLKWHSHPQCKKSVCSGTQVPTHIQ
jgi:hypothetical protein